MSNKRLSVLSSLRSELRSLRDRIKGLVAFRNQPNFDDCVFDERTDIYRQISFMNYYAEVLTSRIERLESDLGL